MMQHHGYSLNELDNMLPYEREIYLALLEDHLEKEAKEMEKQNQQMRRR